MAMKLNKLGEAPSREEVQGLTSELATFWENGGQAHFREEEEILLPAFARYAPVDQQPVIDLLLEHVRIRSLVASIVGGEGDVIADLRQLGVLLEQHVRKEERIVFPLIESALPEEKLAQLKPYFHEHAKPCKF